MNQRGNDPAGRPSAATLSYFQQATDLMSTTVLPAAATLTTANASALGLNYNQDRSAAASGQVLVLVLGLAVAGALLGVQVFLAARYRRLVNPALAAATVLAVGLAIAGAVQLGAQAGNLKVAKQDAFDSILALTQARAVSYDANADETRYLVDPGRATAYQDAFLRKSQELVNVGNVGIFSYDAALAADIGAYQADHADVRFGGYLGTEFRNITFPRRAGRRHPGTPGVPGLREVRPQAPRHGEDQPRPGHRVRHQHQPGPVRLGIQPMGRRARVSDYHQRERLHRRDPGRSHHWFTVDRADGGRGAWR